MATSYSAATGTVTVTIEDTGPGMTEETLSRAFDLKDEYRSLVASESDFDPIRNDPVFQALVRVTV